MRNQIQLMLLRVKFLDVLVNRNGLTRMEALFKHSTELVGIDILLESQIDLSISFSVNDVIGFVLCEIFSKLSFGITWTRVALNRKIAAIKSVKKVEPDWEFNIKTWLCSAQYI
ncbi:hypothetical protein D3C80_947990 [compost metagenome]